MGINEIYPQEKWNYQRYCPSTAKSNVTHKRNQFSYKNSLYNDIAYTWLEKLRYPSWVQGKEQKSWRVAESFRVLSVPIQSF